MHIRIRHEISYSYAAPVLLQPQRIRLRPRQGVTLTVLRHELEVSPPVRPRWGLDAEGNDVAACWFGRTTRSFEVTAESEVVTAGGDPYDFLLDASAVALPVKLSGVELRCLGPALARRVPARGTDRVADLAAEVRRLSGPSTVAFVAAACRVVHERTGWCRRPRGRARPAYITLARGRGACRDSAMLLVDVFRAEGLAARFVSGYAVVPITGIGDDLHAWTEVYLPGAGWRGFDPTRGLAVDDRYVPLAASATPEGAAAISGGFLGSRAGKMKTTVAVAELAAQSQSQS